jgi:hypothetical protein
LTFVFYRVSVRCSVCFFKLLPEAPLIGRGMESGLFAYA